MGIVPFTVQDSVDRALSVMLFLALFFSDADVPDASETFVFVS